MKHSVRLCTYNIHKGSCAINLRDILNDLRIAIRSIDVDLVCLQEVMGTQELSQFEYLADDVWPHHAYGKNAVYQKGHHGNAILSKQPFSEWDNHDISKWNFSRRGILLGKLSNGVAIACIHFGLLKSERVEQLQKLERVLLDNVATDQPLIIAGDFNDWNGHLDCLIKKMSFKEAFTEVHGKLAKTFPARLPMLAMDRIYYRNLNIVDAQVLSGKKWQRLSDHRALLAEFSL
jgi:endonuclease/exonuclease/phosphatase family metal-dependent hydrolase